MIFLAYTKQHNYFTDVKDNNTQQLQAGHFPFNHSTFGCTQKLPLFYAQGNLVTNKNWNKMGVLVISKKQIKREETIKKKRGVPAATNGVNTDYMHCRRQ